MLVVQNSHLFAWPRLNNGRFLVIVSTVLFSMLLASCSDDGDEDPSPNITGSWIFASGVYSSCNDPDNNDSDTDVNGCDDGDCATLSFTSNGTFTFSVTYLNQTSLNSGTYTQSGKKLRLNCQSGNQCEDLPESFDTELSGSNLIISGDASFDGCQFREVWAKQ